MTKALPHGLNAPPPLDTRGRNILHLIEDSIVEATTDEERQARQDLLDRVLSMSKAVAAIESRTPLRRRPPPPWRPRG